MTSPWGEPRTKTVAFHDPLAAAAEGARRTGMEHLQALLAGEIPPAPIARLMGFELVSVSDGEAVFTCTPDESVYNPIGLVHGGLVSRCSTRRSGARCSPSLPAGTGYTSLELKVSYQRAVHGDTGVLTARGWVTRPGRRATFAQGSVTDGRGKVVATASGTCLVMPPAGAT